MDKTHETDTEAKAMLLHGLIVEEFAKLDIFTRPMLAAAIDAKRPFSQLPPKGRQAFLNIAKRLFIVAICAFGVACGEQETENPAAICRALMVDMCANVTSCDPSVSTVECLEAADLIVGCSDVKGLRRDPQACQLALASQRQCPWEFPGQCENLFR